MPAQSKLKRKNSLARQAKSSLHFKKQNVLTDAISVLESSFAEPGTPFEINDDTEDDAKEFWRIVESDNETISDFESENENDDNDNNFKDIFNNNTYEAINLSEIMKSRGPNYYGWSKRTIRRKKAELKSAANNNKSIKDFFRSEENNNNNNGIIQIDNGNEIEIQNEKFNAENNSTEKFNKEKMPYEVAIIEISLIPYMRNNRKLLDISTYKNISFEIKRAIAVRSYFIYLITNYKLSSIVSKTKASKTVAALIYESGLNQHYRSKLIRYWAIGN